MARAEPDVPAPEPGELSALLDAVQQLAQAAGREILEIYASDFAVEAKADRSPLTAADRAAHATIEAGLGRLTPELPVWSEESADIDWNRRSRWTRFWLVDPLDGTREFINRNGEFTVNIALVSGGEPVLGVVHVPVDGRDYLAARGVGAFRAGPDGQREAIRVRRPAASPLRVVGSRSHRGSSLDSFLAALGPHKMVPMGSSLKLCLVAEGSADIYPRLGPTSEWDTAAAQAVVECAGGHVVTLEGEALRYNRPDPLNPHFLVYGDSSRDWAALAR